MSQQLAQHILKFISVNDKELNDIISFFQPLDVKKKQNLLTEGSICKHNYFVEKGLLRMFFVNDKGVENTMQFALEHWWLADYHSFTAQTPSGFYIQAVERSHILSITLAAQEQLLQQHPVMERYFRLVHQKAHASYQFRLKYINDMSREEMYHHFSNHYPHFVQRIPQYLLASFLGFTPEYLSEIRSKRIS